jgi:superfamily II DNA or RNA helicase
VVYDEVHHLAAPMFVTTAPVVPGLRFGLTATDKRADGTDFIYKFHLGGVFYQDRVQKLLPRVYIQETPVYVDITAPEMLDVRGEFHLSKLRSFMGEWEPSNRFRAYCIQEALNEGRKVLCLSQSKAQLKRLNEMFPDSGLVVQETPQEERSAIVKAHPLTFAITSLGFEGLDDETIDTVFALLPFPDPGNMEQAIGRAQRQLTGKNAPVFVLFDDKRIKPLHGQAMRMKNVLENWDKHVPGMPALSVQTLRVPSGYPTK